MWSLISKHTRIGINDFLKLILIKGDSYDGGYSGSVVVLDAMVVVYGIPVVTLPVVVLALVVMIVFNVYILVLSALIFKAKNFLIFSRHCDMSSFVYRQLFHEHFALRDN